MDKPKVYVTRRLPQRALDLISLQCEMKVNPLDQVLTREELLEEVKGIDGLLCLLTDRIDRELLDVNKKLKVISNYAVGYNNIDLEECTKRKILVSNTPGVLTETTADMAFTLLMASARRLTEAERFLRGGHFKGWGPMLFLGEDIYGKTIGIIGLGRIGQAVAKRARGFNMKILYCDTKPRGVLEERELGLSYRPLEALLKESDFVTIHLPLVPETHHLLSTKEFKIMKKTAHLINTARGPIVHEKALVQALKEGEIAGAALDVFEREPVLEEGLLESQKVILVPHIASATIATRTKMALMAAENLLSALKGEPMQNLLNPQALAR